MVKSPPKRLYNKSNQRSRIYQQVKAKNPKKLLQQSAWKMEATKVNSIIEQLDESDGNGHRWNTNINNFASLFESEDKEGTKHRTKPNSPIILLSEDDEEGEKRIT